MEIQGNRRGNQLNQIIQNSSRNRPSNEIQQPIQEKPSIPKFLVKVSSSFFARATAKDIFLRKMNKRKESMQKRKERKQKELEGEGKLKRSKSEISLRSLIMPTEHNQRNIVVSNRIETNFTNNLTEENNILSSRSNDNSAYMFSQTGKKTERIAPMQIIEDTEEYEQDLDRREDGGLDLKNSLTSSDAQLQRKLQLSQIGDDEEGNVEIRGGVSLRVPMNGFGPNSGRQLRLKTEERSKRSLKELFEKFERIKTENDQTERKNLKTEGEELNTSQFFRPSVKSL